MNSQGSNFPQRFEQLKTKLKIAMEIATVPDHQLHRNELGIIAGVADPYCPLLIPFARSILHPQGKFITLIWRLAIAFILIIKEDKNGIDQNH